MTNLDRLKGSELILHNLRSFVDLWATDLAEEFSLTLEVDSAQLPERKHLPDELRTFYEIRDQWPGLIFGNRYDVFKEPKVSVGGYWVFTEFLTKIQLAVRENDKGWGFWVGRWKLVEDDDECDEGDFEEVFEPMDVDLEGMLVEMILSALTNESWGFTSDGSGFNWKSEFEQSKRILNWFRESTPICGGTPSKRCPGCFGYEAKEWRWHPEGLLLEHQWNRFRDRCYENLAIAVNRKQAYYALVAEGWRTRNKKSLST